MNFRKHRLAPLLLLLSCMKPVDGSLIFHRHFLQSNRFPNSSQRTCFLKGYDASSSVALTATPTNKNKHSKDISFSSSSYKFLLSGSRSVTAPGLKNRMTKNDERKQPLMSSVAASMVVSSFIFLSSVQSVQALEQTYPSDLDMTTDATGIVLQDGMGATNAKKSGMAASAKRQKEIQKLNEEIGWDVTRFLRGKNNFAGSLVWGGALWLLAGSRSNPLVTPVANLLYYEEDEQWLRDRNEGLFAPIPPGLTIIILSIFLVLGILFDRTMLILTQGDANLCLQLAGVSLISGGALELGRIAAGEKRQNREDTERQEKLTAEFEDFASKRLKSGGNCHRSEVVAAFRRFYSKYRVADSQEDPLLDLEIERLLRQWSRRQANVDMSSAGFFSGIQINTEADAFVER